MSGCRVREEEASIMSSFFSLGGLSRSQIANPSDYDNTDNCRQGGLVGGGHDQLNHVLHVPPREISFWYDIRPGYSFTNSGDFIIQQQQQPDLCNYASISSRRSSASMSMDCGDDGYRRMMMMMMMKTSGKGSGGGISCQDCGNHAKKDCSHQRCRTCCRSRGFDCPTHVKSTWVPASTRRERQKQRQLECSLSQARSKQPRGAGTSHGYAQPDHSGPDEMGKFPAELNSSVMFRCVCVSSSDEGLDGEQYAYQTAVNIGGHVFKGILYDQGPEHNTTEVAPGESSSCGGSCGGRVTLQPLSLGGRAVESVGAAPTPLFDPYSSMLPPTFNTYAMAGMQFFPHTRS